MKLVLYATQLIIYHMTQLARQLGIAMEQIQQRLPKPSYMEKKTEFNTLKIGPYTASSSQHFFFFLLV